MAVILPLLTFVLLALAFQAFFSRRENNHSWRDSILFAAISWGLLLIAITECLTIFKSITFAWLLTAWGIVAIALAAINYFLIKKSKPAVTFKVSAFEVVLLSAIALIAITTGIIAIMAPPNTWDSMTYHLSRVMHWQQNHSVAHYATHCIRQIYSLPWAEYAILHLQVLSGSDRFASLVQWFNMLGSLLAVSLIAKSFGAIRRGQIFAAAICAAIPMGILQASSTQNDYVLTFWLLCFVYFGLLSTKQWKWYYVCASGVALGIAFLTKGAAYIYAWPFLFWFIFRWIRKLRWQFWKPVFVILFLALVVNGGFFYRNYALFKKPMVSGHLEMMNDPLSLETFVSSVTKNVALHLSSHKKEVNAKIESAVKSFHEFLDVDIDSPGLNYVNRQFYIPHTLFHEDTTGNLLHLLLIVLTAGLWLIMKDLRRLSGFAGYAISITLGFLLLCFLSKWQVWNSRFHLAIFVLWSPLIALMFDKVWNRKVANVLVLLLFLLSLPWVFLNRSRPIISKDASIFDKSRIEQYFVNQPYLQRSYQKTAEFIASRGYQRIGLVMGEDDWEYPLWVFLKEQGQRFVIEHVDVANKTEELAKKFIPEAIIYIGQNKNVMIKYLMAMKQAKNFGPVMVFSEKR